LMVGREVCVFSTSLEAWFQGTISEALPDGCWVLFEAEGRPHRKFLRYESAHLSLAAPAGPIQRSLSGEGLEIDGAPVAISRETAERMERLRRALAELFDPTGFADQDPDRILLEIDPGAPQAPQWHPARGSVVQIPPVRNQGQTPYCAILSLAAIVENLARKEYGVRLDWDCMWRSFCTAADPVGRRGMDDGFSLEDLVDILNRGKPSLPGFDSRGMQAIFTVSLGYQGFASWQEALSEPDHMWVCVEDSVASKRDRGIFHAMYGIGAEHGKLIIMNTWGRLDLRAVDASWLRNDRIKLCSVSVSLHQNGVRLLPAFGPAAMNIPNRRDEPPIGKARYRRRCPNCSEDVMKIVIMRAGWKCACVSASSASSSSEQFRWRCSHCKFDRCALCL